MCFYCNISSSDLFIYCLLVILTIKYQICTFIWVLHVHLVAYFTGLSAH